MGRALLLFLLVLPSCSPTTARFDCISTIKQGEHLMKQGVASRRWHLLDQARQTFFNATQACDGQNSSQARAYFKIGYINLLLSNPKQALVALQASNNLDSTKPSVQLNLAVAWSQLRQYQMAGHQYLRHAKLDPAAAVDSQLAAAKMFFRAGLHVLAEATWNGLVSTLHDLPCNQQAAYYYEIGRAQELNGYWPDASHHVLSNTLSNFTTSLEWSKCAKGGNIALVSCHETVQCRQQLVFEAGESPFAVEPSTLLPFTDTRAVFVQTMTDVTLVGNDAIVLLGAREVLQSDLMPQIPMYRNVPVTDWAFKDNIVHFSAAILAVQTFAVGFYHFLLDVLPRILIAVEIHPNVPLLLPSNDGELHRYMLELLELVGLGRYPRISYNILPGNQRKMDDLSLATPRMKIERLYRVQWTWSDPDQPMHGFLTHYPPERVLQMLQARLTGHYAPPAVRTVLYVRRRNAATRRLNDETQFLSSIRQLLAVLNLASAPKWRLQVMGDDPVPSTKETLRQFQNAHLVLGVHGAGLSNIVACPSGTLVVELALWQPHAQYYRHLATSLGLRYHSIRLNSVEAYSSVSVDVNQSSVIALLQSLLSDTPVN